MAEKIVENKDLFASDLVTKTIKDVQGLVNELDKLEKKIVDVAKVQKSVINTEDNKSIQSIKRTNDALTKLNKASEMSETISKNKIKLESRLKIARKDSIQENEELKVLISEQNKINKTLAKEKLGLVSAYEKESKRLNELRKQYKNLAVSEKGSSKEAKALLIQITALDTKLKAVDRTVGQSQRNVGNYTGAFQKLGSTLRTGLGFLGVATGFALIGKAIRGASETIVKFDESVADISKVTGLLKEDARELAKELLKINTRTSVDALLQLAVAGGRLGLTGRDLIEFTKSTDKAFVSLGDSLNGSAEEIGLSLGKVAANFGVEQEFGIGVAIEKIGSSLNELGANSKASEGDIQDFTNRLAGVGSQAGLTVPEVQSLGALFSETGQSIEVAASTFNKLLPAIGKDTKKFAKLVGLDIKEFEKLVTEKPLEALKLVAKSAQSSEKGLKGLSKTLENYGVDSSRAAGIVGVLSGQTERLTELQELANESFEKGTSLSEEFAIKNETLSAKLEKLSNNYDKLIINIEDGNGILADAFKSAIEGASNLIKSIDEISVALKNFQSIGGEESFGVAISRALGIEGITKPLDQLNIVIDKKTTEYANIIIQKNQAAQKRIILGIQERIKADIDSLDTLEREERLLAERRIKANLLLLDKLKVTNLTTKENTNLTNENTEAKDGNAKKTTELSGLIEKQSKVVSDLNEKIQQARSEEFILKLSLELDVEEEELARLKRIVSSSVEEINAIEIDLIKDQTEKRIREEEEKSRKLIETIRSNSRTELKVKEELINQEEERLRLFTEDENIKSLKAQIKAESDLAKATFEIKRTGFKTEEEFEEEKAAQFKAIKRNELQAELDLLEFYGREEDKLRREQLKAEIQGLNEFGKQAERLTIEALEVIAELVDEGFEKRIESLSKQIDKTSERADQLREKATSGRLASEESLAFEQKKEAELEKQREQERKRQQQTQAFFTVLNTYQSNVNNGDPTPLQSTIRDVAVLRQLASSLSGFYEGTDDVGKSLGKGQLPGKDGHIIRVDKSEQIWSGKDRSDVNFRTRDEIKDIVKKYDSGMFEDMIKFDKSQQFMNPSAFALNGFSDKRMVSELSEIKKGIKGIDIPKGMVDIDQVRGIITLITRKGNTVVKEKSKLFN